MKTSSFYLYHGPGRIAISRTVPKHISGFQRYPALAPGKWLFDETFVGDYAQRYREEILAPLDAQKVWDELHALAGNDEPVLLCHEHLQKPGEQCHRRLVAQWFAEKLGVEVAEMPIVPRAKKPDPQLDLLALL